MKIDPVRGTKFHALVKKHAAPLPQVPLLPGAESNDPLAILLSNYLLWESTPALVAEALQRMSRIIVDANELRGVMDYEQRTNDGLPDPGLTPLDDPQLDPGRAA